MLKHLKIRVTGRVQGVYFRASTRDAAMQLGIKGFTRNETDGCVYIEAEGDEVALQKFVEWCRVGPPRAEVLEVQIVVGELNHFTVFEIKR